MASAKTFSTSCMLAGLLLCGLAGATPAQSPGHGRTGARAFDFSFGTWRTHVSRLAHPLTGSRSWVEYDGTTVVSKVWHGAANLVQLDVSGAAGAHLQLASLRLYDPATDRWSLYVTSIRAGSLGVPTVGGFSNGRGVFYDKEDWNGKPILVRFVITPRGADAVHYVQSFSADDGKTWETNWIADDRRAADPAKNCP